MTDIRLTQYARGGGCSCKIPPGELETVLTALNAGLTQERDATPAHP
ncbi:selenide, water dikinase SelD, partial [Nonomuraea sp. K274]|nr:selenide, water dikinase SelD [Nonomuraea cypriaca]